MSWFWFLMIVMSLDEVLCEIINTPNMEYFKEDNFQLGLSTQGTKIPKQLPSPENKLLNNIHNNTQSLCKRSKDDCSFVQKDPRIDSSEPKSVSSDEGKETAKKWPPWETLKEEDVRTEKDRLYFHKYYFLPPRNTDCDHIKAPGVDYTIVTALIDLRREDWPHFRRQFLKYLFYAVQMLNLHAPMVIYVEPKAVDFVEYHRQGKEHLTQIIPVTVQDLEYYQYYDRIKAAMESEEFKEGHLMLDHPEGFSPDYNILMNSKQSMMYRASTKDYFRTNYFYWMDVGYGHGEDIFPKSCLWSPSKIMNNVAQMTYIELNPVHKLDSIDDLYKQFLPAFLNGAFFGGPKMAVKSYYYLHRKVLLEFLENKQIDDDQTMAVACYFQRPLLFNIVQGWWYDAFTLFQ